MGKKRLWRRTERLTCLQPLLKSRQMCLFYLIPVRHRVSNEDTEFLELLQLKSDVPVLST